MSDQTPPPFPGPAVPPPPPQGSSKKVRNVLLGCLAAALIGIGLVALLLTMVCSQLNNMH